MSAEASVGEIVELAEHHERQAMIYARQAASNAPWKHDHAQDTAKAANHFAVAAAVRAHLNRPDAEKEMGK